MLKKALYGLKQASRAWHEKADEFLLSLGYKKSKYDKCLFMKKHEGKTTCVSLYVDDFFVFSDSIPEVQHRTKQLGEKFPIHDLGPSKNCLGIRATRTENAIILDQEEYVNILLSRFNLAE